MRTHACYPTPPPHTKIAGSKDLRIHQVALQAMQKSHAVDQRIVQNERCKHAAASLYPLLCEWMDANFVSNAFVLLSVYA